MAPSDLSLEDSRVRRAARPVSSRLRFAHAACGRGRCVAFGVGTTAIFNSWITKDVGCSANGQSRHQRSKTDNVTAKDSCSRSCAIPSQNRQAIGKLVEYCAMLVASLSVDSRATMTNMTAELAFTGYVAPDAKTVILMDYARCPVRSGAPGRRARERSAAEYCEARDRRGAHSADDRPPRRPERLHIEDVGQRIRLDIAYAARARRARRRTMDMYAACSPRPGRGERVAPWCASHSMRLAGCEAVSKSGLPRRVRAGGATFLEPSCGAASMRDRAVQDAEEVTISGDHSKFPGRSGPGSSTCQSVHGGRVCDYGTYGWELGGVETSKRHFRRPPIIGNSPPCVVSLTRPSIRWYVSPHLLVVNRGPAKEVFRPNIHAWSRRSGRFVDVNCGAFPTS